MKRVDLFGPPGSGKTTILQAVIKSPDRPDNWYTNKEFYLMACYKLFENKNSHPLDLIKRTGFRLLKKKRLLPISREDRDRFLSSQLQPYKQLLRRVNDSFGKDTLAIPEINSYRMVRFREELENVLLLEHVHEDGLVLFEESLTYRYFEATGGVHTDEEHLRLFQTNPFPPAGGYICIRASFDTLMKRLSRRWKVTHAHRKMSKTNIRRHVQASIRNTDTALKVLEAMNKPVLKIGEEDSVRQAATKIHPFLMQLAKG